MKKGILILIMFYSLYGSAQERERLISNSDKFYDKAGTLFEREFIEIGKITDIEFKVLKVKNLIDNSYSISLRIEKPKSASVYSDNYLGVLDEDEIQGLLKSINIIKDITSKEPPIVYTEIIYKSKTGVEFGCYYKKGRAAKWEYFIQIEKYISASIDYLLIEEFLELPVLLEKAYDKMQEIKN